MTVKHKFISNKSDGNDPDKVKPSNWNDDHDVEIDLSSPEATGILPIDKGGTGADNVAGAIANLFPPLGYAAYFYTDGYNVFWNPSGGGGGGSPSGNDGDIQINSGGSFLGVTYFNFDYARATHTIGSNDIPDFPRQIKQAAHGQVEDVEQWQDEFGDVMSAISRNGGFKPPQMKDNDAENNTIYFSINMNVLAYKDPSGHVFPLY